jgi:cysteinyl-tRNA synthetase
MTILNSGYRGPLTFTEEVIGQSERGLERLHSALRPELPNAKGATDLAVLDRQVNVTRENFVEAMDDDFNSAGALAVLFDLVREINQARANGATNAQLKPAQDLLCELTNVLGLTMKETISGDQTAKPFIDLLVELRLELRKQKQYALGDMVRQRLTGLGVILEDSKDGTTWRWG